MADPINSQSPPLSLSPSLSLDPSLKVSNPPSYVWMRNNTGEERDNTGRRHGGNDTEGGEGYQDREMGDKKAADNVSIDLRLS